MLLANLLFIALVAFQGTERPTAKAIPSSAVVGVVAFEKGKSIKTDDLTTMNPSSFGMGVIISSKGSILTTRHQLGDLNDNEWKVLWVDENQNVSIFNTKLVGASEFADLAVLSIHGEASQPWPAFSLLEQPNSIEVEERVKVLVNFSAIKNGDRETPQDGKVAALRNSISNRWVREFHLQRFFQVELAGDHWVSGGAILNSNDELIGLTSALQNTNQPATQNTANSSQGNWAAPIDEYSCRVIAELLEGRLPGHGYLGLKLRDLSDQQRTLHGGLRGVQVIDVDNRFSEVAPLRFSDLITHANGVEITSADQLLGIVARHQAGQTLSLRWLHGALSSSPSEPESKQAEITLSKRFIEPRYGSFESNSQSAWRGMKVDYPQAIRDYDSLALLIDPEGCLAITEVQRDSAAWNAGLRPMMVIRSIGGSIVKSPADFFRAVNLGKGTAVSLVVVDSATLEPREVTVDP